LLSLLNIISGCWRILTHEVLSLVLIFRKDRLGLKTWAARRILLNKFPSGERSESLTGGGNCHLQIITLPSSLPPPSARLKFWVLGDMKGLTESETQSFVVEKRKCKVITWRKCLVIMI